MQAAEKLSLVGRIDFVGFIGPGLGWRYPPISRALGPFLSFGFSSSGRLGKQPWYSDQVVGGGGEGEDGFGFVSPPDLHLIETGLGLDPAEDLLDVLADALVAPTPAAPPGTPAPH